MQRLAPPFELFGSPDDLPVVMSGQIHEYENEKEKEKQKEKSFAELMHRLNQPRLQSTDTRRSSEQPDRSSWNEDVMFVDSITDDEQYLQEQEAKRSIWRRSDRWLVVILCGIAIFLASFGTGCFQPAQVTLEGIFHTNFLGAVIIFQSFTVVAGIAPLFLSGIVESAQRRLVYIVCVPIFALLQIGTAFVPAAHNFMPLLITLRCLTGLAAAPFISLGTACVIDTFRQAQVGLGLGLLLLPSAVGTVIGPIIGGYLLEYLDWRWTLWLPGILASVHFVLLLLWLPETKIASWANHPGWATERGYWSSLESSVAAGAQDPDSSVNSLLSKQQQQRAEDASDRLNPFPLVFSLLREYPFTMLVAASRGMTLSTSLMVFPFQQQILSTRWFFNPVKLGYSFLPSSVGAVVGSLICGPVTEYFGRVIGLQAGPLICALISDLLFTVFGLMWISLVAVADPWLAISLTFFIGFCIRVSRVGYFSTVVAYCPKRAITLTTILQFVSFGFVGVWSVVDPLVTTAADSNLLPLIINLICCIIIIIPCTIYALRLFKQSYK